MIANTVRGVQMVTVLVVDDDTPITGLLRDMLEDGGHTVLVAYDGQQGLALARTHAPAIVFTDHMMPYLNGMELVGILLADPSLRHTALVLMSASPVAGLAAVAAVTFLAKPFEIDTVMDLVARCV